MRAAAIWEQQRHGPRGEACFKNILSHAAHVAAALRSPQPSHRFCPEIAAALDLAVPLPELPNRRNPGGFPKNLRRRNQITEAPESWHQIAEVLKSWLLPRCRGDGSNKNKDMISSGKTHSTDEKDAFYRRGRRILQTRGPTNTIRFSCKLLDKRTVEGRDD